MSRLGSEKSSRRAVRMLLKGIMGALSVILFVLLARALLMPDPAAALFARAQRLEANGLWEQALRHYELLAETEPTSTFAPRALQQQAVILTGMARRSGDEEKFRQAIAVYEKLADIYPNSLQAGEALLAAGEVAINDLNDTQTGTTLYETVLERFPNNREYVSEATLRLGRIALLDGDGHRAQELFQRVLQQYQRFRERCAEAQYHLGIVYETLFQKPEWAQNAYQAVIDNYPASRWTTNAKERLGLIYFSGGKGRPAARHVEIETAPVSQADVPADSPLAALLPLLAARGLEPNQAILEGWSLTPFYAGFNPANPGQVVRLTLNRFDTVAANAGLLYSPLRNEDAKTALADLQDEVDAARPPVIYHGSWSLVVGYDTQRDEVLLQGSGARIETVAVKELSEQWKLPAPNNSPAKGSWALLRFYTPGEKPQLTERPKPAPGEKTPITGAETIDDNYQLAASATPAPRETPTFTVPGLGATPNFHYKVKPLSMPDTHRRTLRRARDLMARTQAGEVLLNAEALDALARELENLAAPLPARRTNAGRVTDSTLPDPNTGDGNRSPLPMAEGEVAPDTDLNPPEEPAPRVLATPSTPDIISPEAIRRLERAQKLREWFGAPLREWLGARRNAATYLRAASNSMKSSAARQAAEAFDQEISALKNAAEQMPSQLSADGSTLDDDARRSLQAIAAHLRAARDAEKRALAAMSKIG